MVLKPVNECKQTLFSGPQINLGLLCWSSGSMMISNVFIGQDLFTFIQVLVLVHFLHKMTVAVR